MDIHFSVMWEKLLELLKTIPFTNYSFFSLLDKIDRFLSKYA